MIVTVGSELPPYNPGLVPKELQQHLNPEGIEGTAPAHDPGLVPKTIQSKLKYAQIEDAECNCLSLLRKGNIVHYHSIKVLIDDAPLSDPSTWEELMGKIQEMYSYVVEHDYGLSPNPNGGFCTLAFCKFSKDGRKRNVVELAREGDWIVGTGGNSQLSAGHGKLVYAMLVTEKMTLQDYFRDPRFKCRAGNENEMHLAGSTDRFALISDQFFYFGRNAPNFENRHLDYPIEKRGPSHKRPSFKKEFIADFVAWLEENYTVGIHGDPCAECDQEPETCEAVRTRKKCPPRRRLGMC